MTWDINAPYKPESQKCIWEVAPYLKGRGVDLGAGTFKILPHAMSVDNGHHEAFGHHIKPDVRVDDAEDLSIFGSQSMDFVYSSHLLEHIVDPKKALKEWWRILRVKGHLVLYLPHDELYPKCGENGANPDHKHNLNESKVLGWMKEVASGFDLLECQRRDQDDEYSFLMVFKKLDGKRQLESWKAPRPEKTACVVRYGAFGDLMQSSSVWAGLKQQGYHVTLFTADPGAQVITHDPNIDRVVVFDKDQVPNANLGDFWAWHKKKYDKWVNLSESVEGTMLAMPGRTQHGWSPMVRHKRMNENYVEFQHELAGVPHNPQVKFYATDEEKSWAAHQRKKMGAGPIVLWSLAGSSVHKTWSGLDAIIASFMISYPESHVVLVGGPECVILEAGWENEPRVHKTSGKWSIRQSLAFLDQADLVIGPETGVLNAAACMEVPKIVFLSHSTHENLTRDWRNVFPLFSANTECPGRGANEAPACHQLHYGWAHCKQHPERGTAQCQADISEDVVWDTVKRIMKYHTRPILKVA